MADPQKDLDAFLTAVESKLRGPFSSLDLTKTVTTTALRGSLSRQEYLNRICRVLSRTDKVIRMRILIGLLGLDPAEDTDPEIDAILTAAQEGKLHEEWVRVIAGIIQGIMFQEEREIITDEEGEDAGYATVICRGKAANDLLTSTCQEIIDRVRQLENKCDRSDETDPHLLVQDDVDPVIAPYRFALLNPKLLHQSIPDLEIDTHGHFTVNEEADILRMDRDMEIQKEQEEMNHAKQAGIAAAAAQSKTNNNASDNKSSSGPAAARAPAAAILPGGFRSTKASAKMATTATTTANSRTLAGKPTLQQQHPKSNMFMPTKKPGQKPLQLAAAQTTLRVRKQGASQAIVGKGRQAILGGAAATAAGGGANSGSSGTTDGNGGGFLLGQRAGATGRFGGNASGGGGGLGAAGVRGRANRLVNATKSKMKIIDVTEVQEMAQKEQMSANTNTRGAGRGGRGGAAMKRKLTAGQGKSGRLKKDPGPHDKQDNDEEDADSQSLPPPEPAANGFAIHHDDSDEEDDDEPQVAPAATVPNSFADHHDEDDDDDDQDGTSPQAAGATTAGALALDALNAYRAQLAVVGGGAQQQQPTAHEQQQYHAQQQPKASPETNHHQQQQQQQQQAQQHAQGGGDGYHPHHRQQDWRQLLKTKSNRLTPDDRMRVQQFFVDRVNPTPDQLTYRMKLHEERTTDPRTGEPVKETYYLELDYSNFTSKQSKKVKRYKEGS